MLVMQDGYADKKKHFTDKLLNRAAGLQRNSAATTAAMAALMYYYLAILALFQYVLAVSHHWDIFITEVRLSNRVITTVLGKDRKLLDSSEAIKVHKSEENRHEMLATAIVNGDKSRRILVPPHLNAYAQLISSNGDQSLELPGMSMPTPRPSRHPVQPQDYQSCGFTAVQHAQYPGTHFRVVGGRKASAGAWPWMAALGYVRGSNTVLEFHCGGSLVSAVHVITAAHCVQRPNLTLKAVRLGVLQLTDRTAAVDVLVSHVSPHPHFRWDTAANDIAVVFLANPVKFTAFIHPICLPNGKMLQSDMINTFPFVTGWGLTEDEKPSLWLKEVRIPVITLARCRQVYSELPADRTIPITTSQLCCGFQEGGRDACQGDSGGPLMLPAGAHPRGDVYFLIGIVSLGEGCAQPSIPGVFTKVSSYLDWLIMTMGELPNGPLK